MKIIILNKLLQIHQQLINVMQLIFLIVHPRLMEKDVLNANQLL